MHISQEHSEKLSWDSLVEKLEAGNLRSITRIPEIEAEYSRFQEKLLLLGSNIENHAHNNLLGRSGATIEPCFKCLTIKNDQGVEFDVYIQFDASQFTPKPWLQKFTQRMTSLSQAFPEHLSDESRNLIMFTRNSFQYNLVDEIDHWVIWCSQIVEREFIQQVSMFFISPHEHSTYIHINPSYKRSVLKVFHAHLFVQ